MKVAYVLGTSAGGTARHVRMLADGLARRGVTVSVYAPAGTWPTSGTRAGTGEGAPAGGGAPAAQSVPAGEGALPGPGESTPAAAAGAQPPRFAAVEIADRPRPARDLAAVLRLRALLARSRPDIVHAHGLRAGALAALATGRGSGSRPGLIVTVHNAAPAGGPAGAVYRVLERLVAHRADQVLCVSGDLESRMRRLGATCVGRALVPAPPAAPGVSAEALARLRAELGIGGHAARVPAVLAVARLAPQKGLDTLIAAAGCWRDRDPAPLVLIAGTGPLRSELGRRALAAGVPVRFLGHRDDVPALLAVADVVVLPSTWEGQPLIVQETLRAGRPLVAARVGGIPDLTGEDGALLVPPGDAGALAGAVLSVLDDPRLATRLSESAVKRAAALPTETEALTAALTAYQRLASGPGSATYPGL